MKRVLLLGDSIRLFYQDRVKRLLEGEYEVVAPKENCRFSLYALNSLRMWLPAFPDVDVIHFNFGLWDIVTLYREDGCFTPLPLYLETMNRILRELKKTGAKLIFATTTPGRDEKKYLPGPTPPALDNADVMRYNEALLQLWKDEDLAINDLFSLMYPHREKWISDDLLHPNNAGTVALGDAVAGVIRQMNVPGKQHAPLFGILRQDEKTLQ